MADKKNYEAGHVYNYRSNKDNKNAVESTKGDGHEVKYRPSNKKDRDARKRAYERFCAMRDSDLRKEAEKEWELGRKMIRMWAPEKSEDDWGADVVLPDGFSAIQTHLQETIDANFRPVLDGVESSDDILAQYNNNIFQHAMNTTEFDQEMAKARSVAAALGTSFTREEYRYETRIVMDPTSFKDGEMKYTKKEILDWDDVYTRQVRNENCFFDERAEDQKYGNDCVYREILDHDTFVETYKDKDGFKDIDKVVPAGRVDIRSGYFKMANDMDKNDVEILHYENKLYDAYDVLCNNVLIRTGPLPSKHKQLTLDIHTFYPIEGQTWGMGIPRIIYTLVEERRTNRNQRIDRGTMQNHKMFLVNDLFDIDEDDLTPRPHGLAKINTNGLPIQQAVMALEYGDVPASSIRMDEELLADERRAHGMQESIDNQPGGTATQAAIMKESTQRRINLINTLSAWNSLVRVGKKKWSNILFYYPAPRIERIMEDNKWREKKKYRTIKTPGQTFVLYGDPSKGETVELRAQNIQGVGRSRLDPTYARYMKDDFDVVMDVKALAIISKPIKQQQTNEMFDRVMNNPTVARYADGQKALKRMLVVNDEQPSDWMINEGMSEQDMRQIAEQENHMFVDMETSGKIFAIPGTPKATEAHTEVHLAFTRTPIFHALSDALQRAISNHILEENEKNPNTKNMADMNIDPNAPPGGQVDPLAALMGGAGGGLAVPPGQPGGPDAGAGGGMPSPIVAGGDVTNDVPVA